MRSLLIILGAVALLVGGFFAYYALQSGTRPTEVATATPGARPAATAPVAPPREGEEGAGPAGPGNDVWVQSLDEKMRVAFQFRASRYDPTKEGPVDVTNPQAEVFTGPDDARQVVRIEGKTGRVVMPSGAAQRTQIRGTEPSAPRRGELKDVTISLYDESDRSRALMVCRVNNVTFDNDTFRIATESYTGPDGAEVPADQVNVEVRGDDFDFDGRGLTIQWNEADRRLQLLEIAHGNRLTIKSSEMLQALDRSDPRTSPSRERARRDAGETPVVLASAKQPALAKPTSAATTTSAAPLYRATFHEDVRITRGDEALASADQMVVDFISDRDEPVSTQGGARRKATTVEARPRPEPGRAAPAPPATAPAQPVVINWVGKMRVTAVEAADAPRPAPGSINVAMTSLDARPVVLNHQGMNVTCAAFDYRSGDDSLTITSSNALPEISMKLANGTTIHTPSVVYTGADARAKLAGRSSAEIPLPEENGQPAQRLSATWSETAELALVPGPGGARDLRPQRATFAGDVRVDHPQLALRAQSLELGFDPLDRSEQPTPNEVKAKGGVHCRLTDASGDEQNIQCDDLDVAVAPAADGKLAPKTVTADGNVVATNTVEELRCGHLAVALATVIKQGAAPADDRSRPAAGVWGGGEFRVETVTAQDDVKLTTRDGRTAAAQQVHVKQTADGTVAELMGQPATLSDGTSTLSGPHIKFEEGTQRASVQGPGTLALVVRDNPDRPARPVNAAWDSSLSYDGLANRAELTGGASVAAPAADGSKQTASADRIIVEFADAPADTHPGPTTASAARVDGAAGAKPGVDHFDLAGDKAIRRITLAGNAQVQSTLDGQREGELRRIHLLAPEVRYDVEAKRAEVPGGGRMLVQDTLPARGDAPAGNRMLGDFRGATAFQWARDLVFDEADNRMTMSGDVLIVHEDPSRPGQSFRLEAAQVRADMIDDASARKADTGAPSDALFGPSELHLRSLSASGDIRLSAPQIQIEAQDVAYDAQAELLTARGNERQPVELYNESGVSRGSFQEVVWDVRAEQIHRMREARGQVRR